MTLQERDELVIWHPFTHQKNRPPVIPIVKGKATLLFDENHQVYIDAISSWWVNLHGHAHPYIAQKLYEQALTLEQVIFAGFTHEPAVALAEKLLTILPSGMSRIFYSDNGSTSTEVAIKMSLQYWWNQQEKYPQSPNRTKILAFKDAYHGDTFGAMSVSDRSVFTLPFHEKLFEVISIDTPNADNIQELQHQIQAEGSNIAAFIYEPLVQGAGGIKMYAPEYMDKLLATAQAAQIICIADEVMTGFGRTGKLFASSYMTHQPDIICLSKGLTGGTMALGVTACKKHIYEAFVNDDKLKTFFHGHSFTANPLACTAALASLDLLIVPACNAQIAWLSAQNFAFASKLARGISNPEKPLPIKNIRVLGTILAFEITNGKDEYLNNIAGVITSLAMQQGVYIRPLGNTVYIMPPYCTTEQELLAIYQCLNTIIEHFRGA